MDVSFVAISNGLLSPAFSSRGGEGEILEKKVFTIRCAVFSLSSSGGEGWREEALYMLPDAGQHCSATP